MNESIDLGMNDPLKIIITSGASDSLAIEEAFYQPLCGQVVISKCSEVKNLNMPILPVGTKSALLVTQAKINETRLLHDYENNAIIVSTTTFISEVHPQRQVIVAYLFKLKTQKHKVYQRIS